MSHKGKNKRKPIRDETCTKGGGRPSVTRPFRRFVPTGNGEADANHLRRQMPARGPVVASEDEDTLGPLPLYWEERFTQRGKKFYVNHRVRSHGNGKHTCHRNGPQDGSRLVRRTMRSQFLYFLPRRSYILTSARSTPKGTLDAVGRSAHWQAGQAG